MLRSGNFEIGSSLFSKLSNSIEVIPVFSNKDVCNMIRNRSERLRITRSSCHSLPFGYLPQPAHIKRVGHHSQKLLKRLELSHQDGG